MRILEADTSISRARRLVRAGCVLLGAGLCFGCGAGPAPKGEGERSPAAPREPIPARPGTFHGVGVALTGRSIQADAPVVPEGDVVFSVANSAARAYTFVVTGQGMSAQVGPIAPRGTARLDTRLEPGTYELRTIPEQVSPVPGEIRRTLTVTAGDASPPRDGRAPGAPGP